MVEHLFKESASSVAKKTTAESESQESSLDDLQQVVGNQAVQRLLGQKSERSSTPLFIQAKLTVGAADDPHEHEADRVASQVMKMSDDQIAQTKRADIQREGEEDEELAAKRVDIQRDDEEEELAAKRVDIQREGEEEELAAKRVDIQREGEEDEELAAKRIEVQRVPQDMMQSFDVDSNVENKIQTMKGGGEPLPESARDFFEPRFGQDFSDVRIHANAESDHVNKSIAARAFTSGNDIFVQQDEYKPDTSSGRELLAHELTHVVQQTGGKAQAKRDKD